MAATSNTINEFLGNINVSKSQTDIAINNLKNFVKFAQTNHGLSDIKKKISHNVILQEIKDIEAEIQICISAGESFSHLIAELDQLYKNAGIARPNTEDEISVRKVESSLPLAMPEKRKPLVQSTDQRDCFNNNVWLSKDGRCVRITEMENSHLMNNIAYIERSLSEGRNPVYGLGDKWLPKLKAEVDRRKSGVDISALKKKLEDIALQDELNRRFN